MTTEETIVVEETSDTNLVHTIALIAAGAATGLTAFAAYRTIKRRRDAKKAQMILDAMFESMDPEIAQMIKDQIETLENNS